MEEITVSEESAHGAYISYLYNALAGVLARAGGAAEFAAGGERTAVRLRFEESSEVREALKTRLSEIIGIGYKYEFLRERLRVCLGAREEKQLCAALIAADFESDGAYLRRKLGDADEYCIDGFSRFRLAALRDKWQRIVDYVPEGFCSADLKQFCEFLVGESQHKIYLKGRTVFGENFAPLRRSRLLGEEDAETEILLSDAGFVYCLGEVEEGLGEFLQKFYAERAIFS